MLDPMYLKWLKKKWTQKILKSISQIIQFLFDCYGQLDYNYQKSEEEKVENYVYDMNNPLVFFFNAMENFISIATAAKLGKL